VLKEAEAKGHNVQDSEIYKMLYVMPMYKLNSDIEEYELKYVYRNVSKVVVTEVQVLKDFKEEKIAKNLGFHDEDTKQEIVCVCSIQRPE